MVQVCRHIMPSGLRCQSPAMRGYAFCYHHARRAVPAQRKKASEQPIALPERLDRQSIGNALNSILQGLASGRVSVRRAGLLLYGIQMAAKQMDLGINGASESGISGPDWMQLLTGSTCAPHPPR